MSTSKNKKSILDNQKLFKNLCKIYDDIVLFICVIFLLVGSYTCYDSYQLFYHAQDKSILKYKPRVLADGTVEVDQSMILNDLVGWVTIDNTSIDYPIMQGENNNTYLNTDPYGNYSLSGSIFMDCRNSPIFSDYYSLVYGHHMENGYMFGALDDFNDKSYFDKHRTGTLIISNGGTSGKICNLNLFAVIDTQANNNLFEPKDKEITLEDIKKDAIIFYEPNSTSNNVIALSTCQSMETIGRSIVVAEIIETGKSGDMIETPEPVQNPEEHDVKPVSENTESCFGHWIILLFGVISAIIAKSLKNKTATLGIIILDILVITGIMLIADSCVYDIIATIVIAVPLYIILKNQRKASQNDGNQ